MALGSAIAAEPIGAAGLRGLATEQVGPRPAGTRADSTRRERAEVRTLRATKP
jgi:hypothetical protein